MRPLFYGLCLSLATAVPPSARAGDVDVRVILSGQVAPGVYGRVDFGTAAPPPVVYATPVIIAPPPGPRPAPVYLHVPPGHAKHWDKHCARYHACGQPVYFVKSAEYEPGYKAKGKGKKD